MDFSLQTDVLVVGCHTAPPGAKVRMIVGTEEKVVYAIFFSIILYGFYLVLSPKHSNYLK